jgi:DnaA family protein
MQLPLAIKLPDSATFSNLIHGRNAEAIGHIQSCLSTDESVDDSHAGQAIYLWGASGSGKSHVLQAACHYLSEQGAATVYLPMRDYAQLNPSMLEGVDSLALVCIDDIDAIAGQRDWEDALFHLYNRMQTAAGHLLLAGIAVPAELGLNLADLSSRLSWGWVFHLQALSDIEKKQALQLRASTRGFTLPDEVGDYLLRYFPRDTHALFALLDRLDIASLVEQRRLTVPWVKKVLSTEC